MTGMVSVEVDLPKGRSVRSVVMSSKGKGFKRDAVIFVLLQLYAAGYMRVHNSDVTVRCPGMDVSTPLDRINRGGGFISRDDNNFELRPGMTYGRYMAAYSTGRCGEGRVAERAAGIVLSPQPRRDMLKEMQTACLHLSADSLKRLLIYVIRSLSPEQCTAILKNVQKGEEN